jgi:O-antigen/teichoic acid export membrane protein
VIEGRKLLISYGALGATFLITIIMNPLIVRLGGKDLLAFAVLLGSILSYVSMCDLGISAMLSRGVVLTDTKGFQTEALSLVNYNKYKIFIAVVLASALLFCLNESIKKNSFLVLVSIFILLSIKPIDAICQGLLVGVGRADMLSASNLISTSIRSFGMLCIVAFSIDHLIYIALAIGSLLPSIILILIYKKNLRLDNKIETRKDYAINFLNYAFFASLSGIFFLNFDKILLSNYQELGTNYLVAWGLVGPGIALIYPVIQVYQRRVTEGYETKVPKLKTIIEIYILLALIYITPISLILINLDFIMHWWIEDSVDIDAIILNSQIVLICLIIYSLALAPSMMLISMGKYKELFFGNIISVLISTLMIMLAGIINYPNPQIFVVIAYITLLLYNLTFALKK